MLRRGGDGGRDSHEESGERLLERSPLEWPSSVPPLVANIVGRDRRRSIAAPEPWGREDEEFAALPRIRNRV